MGRLGRFAFGKFLFAVAFVMSTLVLGLDADAGVSWCESDPLFLVNGGIVDVTTAFPAGYKNTIKDPIAIELLVPTNAVAVVLSLPTEVPMTARSAGFCRQAGSCPLVSR